MDGKNKNGFTLIELLAVIVILAVIALIATPIIMNVINDSKRGAAKDAMYGYVKAVELASTKLVTATTDTLSGEFTTVDGNLYTGDVKVLDIHLKGNKPSDREGSVTLQNGRVVKATLKFDGHMVGYDGSEVSLTTHEIGEVVYFDPTGQVADCKSGKEWTLTNTGTTCYKWNVIKDNGNTLDILLDHNSTGKAAWISKTDYIAAGGIDAEYGTYGNNKYGPITADKQLKTDIATWNVAVKNTARLMTGQEVANIVKNTSWEPGGSPVSLSTQSWLYQNLSNDNTIEKPIGYWTTTANSAGLDSAWLVDCWGGLGYDYVTNVINSGIRPVITISKSLIG